MQQFQQMVSALKSLTEGKNAAATDGAATELEAAAAAAASDHALADMASDNVEAEAAAPEVLSGTDSGTVDATGGTEIRGGSDDTSVALTTAMAAVMSIINASVCDDVAADQIFGLEGEASLSGKEGEKSLSDAVIKAEIVIKQKISDILSKSHSGGARTKAAKVHLSLLHSHAKDLLKSSVPPDRVVSLLKAYASVFRPLLPSTFDGFSDSVLKTDYSYDTATANAIATAIPWRI